MNYRAILIALFPMRTHLCEEIDYLRSQVAQKQRRIDELQEALIAIKQPAPRVPPTVTESPKFRQQPLGIDAVRAARRANPPEEPEPVQGAFDAV
jgi:hypothetical protein